MTRATPQATFAPLPGTTDPWAWSPAAKVFAIVAGSMFLALSSWIEVPMIPVPLTMQTLAVPLVGAVLGWRLGGITIAAWLIEGAMGLPVLAGGAAGAHHFVGPTAGYLFAFPLAGMLMGWLAARGWNGHRVGLAFVGMVLANATCLFFGAAWLALAIGIEPAVMHGVVPFLLGAVLKSALGAAILMAVARGKARRG